ncbi:hypothetical protein FHS42_000351 [Streptomyces zagrosensis]|uniref:Inositolphosphotransferase Aur1/Ipt1 domain-containing protein n=1 Tax=Streptomyces zagrosensis TaxID=1042984 RepID=A0A7W9UW20_9ACTN|nr:hypothetical protein [Streptomyces zagrosensis]
MGEATLRTPEGRNAAPPPPIEERAGARQPTVSERLARLRLPRRPRLWFEILLIAVSYWTYSLIRNAVPAQKTTAFRNADWIWRAEDQLGLAFEHSVNHGINSVTWLIVGMNYYYATLHFVVTIGVLVWLYRWHPGRYAATRLVLFATTGVALIGFYFFPLAPPRLMPGMGFIDTVIVHHTWGSMASGNLAEVSNQYAAMPSMHIGWSTWCGLTIAALASRRWVKALGVLYPMATLVVIVATANHFWLDAIGGLICLTIGFTVAAWWYTASPYQLPQHIAGPARSAQLRRWAPAGGAGRAALAAPAAGSPRTPGGATAAHAPSRPAPTTDAPAVNASAASVPYATSAVSRPDGDSPAVATAPDTAADDTAPPRGMGLAEGRSDPAEDQPAPDRSRSASRRT